MPFGKKRKNWIHQLAFLVSVLVFFPLTGCVVVNFAELDPSGPDVAEITGSSALGPTGVPVSISAIDDQPRVFSKPSWKRKMSPGPHRVTVNVIQLLSNGSTELPFEALPGHKYELRARDGSGFYFLDLVDVSDGSSPKVVISGKFGASGRLTVTPFIQLPVGGK
jgi:hypothetical protein